MSLQRKRPSRSWLPLVASLLAIAALAFNPSGPIQAQGVVSPHPTVARSVYNDESEPLSVLATQLSPKGPPAPGQQVPIIVEPEGGVPNPTGEVAGAEPDPVVQLDEGVVNMPAPVFPPFEGISSADNAAIRGVVSVPPDTNGSVGPSHYVQIVNRLVAVFSKQGNRLLGPVLNVSIFAGFPGLCSDPDVSGGDPIVLFDHLANRWLLSYFVGSDAGENHQCIAISTTGDPTGTWFRYDFFIDNPIFNDYPHFGIWPDAYYMVAGGRSDPGQVFAFERAQMLVGGSARMVTFQTTTTPTYVGLMPSSLDGPPPAAGTPNYFVGVNWTAPQALLIFQFHVDWATLTNSTFGINGQPNAALGIPPFSLLCASDPATINRNCIPQPGTTVGIDALSGRVVMYRAQFRHFLDHEAIVFNHTVDAGGGRAGVRWYEVRNPGGNPVLFQSSTFAPNDSLNRWMGSAALDSAGNLAIGYSVSSATVFPSIRYAGRLVTDPLNQLAQGEAVMQVGNGSQLSTSNRWGDYSNMAVDPVDNCTFWFTTEYIAVTGDVTWQTKIGAFKFPNCP